MVNQNLAEQIQSAVERALTTQNFSGLTQNISEAVNTSIAQIETNSSRANEPQLEHVNGEIVTDESIADYQARKRAAEEEANRARYNSRRAEEARMQEEARQRREEEMRARTKTYQNSNQSAGNAGQPGRPGSGIADFVSGMINGTDPRSPFYNHNSDPNVNGPRSQYYARGGRSAEQRNTQSVSQQKGEIVPISRTPAGSVSGPLLTAFGSIGMLGSYSMLAVTSALSGVGIWPLSVVLPIASFAMVPVAIISTIMTVSGIKKIKRVGRFRQYIRQLRGRAYCTIKELSSHIGKSERFVLKDMRKMISLGMFPEGHIDDQETCVMLNGPTYDQYRKAQNSYLARQKESQLTGQTPGSLTDFSGNSSAGSYNSANTETGSVDRSKLPPKVQQTLKLGEQYLVSIREANAAIPGEIITAKLDKLEQIIAKIYARIERHPEQVDELDKFINYYLPTTQKLVLAYREFDSQPVQGETIQNSKKEIESTLDMILYAFEQLLDSLYEDDAMDISTDISVLQTMFAQEGLTKKDFHTTP